jgi:hypothetical protein
MDRNGGFSKRHVLLELVEYGGKLRTRLLSRLFPELFRAKDDVLLYHDLLTSLVRQQR